MVTSKDGNRLIVNKGAFQAAQEVKNLPVNAGDAGSIPVLSLPTPPSPSQPCVLRGCEEMSLCPQSSLRSVPVSRFSGLALLWVLGFALPLPLCFGLHLSSHSALCPDFPLQAKPLFAWSQGHAAVSGWGFVVLFQQFHSHPPASVPSFPGSVRRTSLAPLPSCPCVPLRTPEAGAVPGHQGMERGAAR